MRFSIQKDTVTGKVMCEVEGSHAEGGVGGEGEAEGGVERAAVGHGGAVGRVPQLHGGCVGGLLRGGRRNSG